MDKTKHFSLQLEVIYDSFSVDYLFISLVHFFFPAYFQRMNHPREKNFMTAKQREHQLEILSAEMTFFHVFKHEQIFSTILSTHA